MNRSPFRRPLHLAALVRPDADEDRYKRAADQRAGAWSILTGIAGDRSLERGGPVRIDQLIHDLDEPDYPPMPTPGEPLESPGRQDAAPDWFKST